MVNDCAAGSYFSKILDLVDTYGVLSSFVGFELERREVLSMVTTECDLLIECVGRDSFALVLLASEAASDGHRELADIIIATNGDNHGWIL